jgi:trk system potassium uptake protein TrkA
MKIIILGAGQVGGTLAENLAGENNDITIVDTDSERLRELQDKFDLRVVNGHGAHPRVLREAGAQDADMLVAVTNSDETNMVACQVAYSCSTPRTRWRAFAPRLSGGAGSPVPARIRPRGSPDRPRAVGDRLRASPDRVSGALQVVDFADGKVGLVAVKAYYGGPLVGNALSTLREHMPNIETRVAAIFRQGRSIRPRAPPSSKPMTRCSSWPRRAISAP